MAETSTSISSTSGAVPVDGVAVTVTPSALSAGQSIRQAVALGDGGGAANQFAAVTTASALKVDGSAVTQPVSHAYSETADAQTAVAASAVGLAAFNGTTVDRLRATGGALNTSRLATRSIILASAAYTANTNSSTLAAAAFTELGFYVNVTAVSGTSPSLTVSVQSSSDGGTTWFTIATGTALTVVGTQKIDVGVGAANNVTFGDTVRAVATITGTTPSFTLSITAIGK